jgi:glycerol kinase
MRGGRFLKHYREDGWYEMHHEAIMRNVRQRLRKPPRPKEITDLDCFRIGECTF